MRIVRNVVTGIICALGTVAILLMGMCLFFQLTPSYVLTGSMAPEIPVGSMIFTNNVSAADVKVGDVVMVPRPGSTSLVTHRVVSIEPEAGQYKLTLKGDANYDVDPDTYLVDSVGLYRFNIPWLGYACIWVQANPVLAGAIVLIMLAITFLAPKKVTLHLPDGTVIKNLSKAEGERLLKAYQHEGGEENKDADADGETDGDSSPLPSRALVDDEPGQSDGKAGEADGEPGADELVSVGTGEPSEAEAAFWSGKDEG